jgi:tRNA U34 5-carboxymethylaminomethyl modifying enzyme MnmG/GidA
MTYSNFDLRLKGLEANVEKASELIEQYQTELTVEDDPQRKSKYNLRIEQLKKLVKSYQEDLNNLRSDVGLNQNDKTDTIAIELNQINSKINALGNLILRSHTTLVKQLNQNQIYTVEIITDALEANHISEVELESLLKSVRQALTSAERKGLSISIAQKEIAQVIDDPSVGIKHKVKVSIPIIPLFLDYEAELELGTEFNLKLLWEKWKNRFQKTK